jgi:hypothetical protein
VAKSTFIDGEPWVEMTLSAEWTAVFRIAPDAHGNPAIAELRVHPTDAVPAGGLRKRTVVNDLSFQVPLMFAQQSRAAFSGETTYFPEIETPRWQKWLAELAPQPDRRDDYFYAMLAAAYANKIASGNRHAGPELAHQLGVHDSTLRQWLSEARKKRGVLTETTPGRASGELTEKGANLLRQLIGGAGGIPSAEAFGTPTIIQHPPRKGQS